MNAFLLGLTAALIMVLGALFAAPVFIDWNDYRPLFETQASKLFGREVKVGGKVHLVLLPAPELRFDDVRVADAQGGFDEPLLEVGSIEAWLNIGALLRGAIEARKITIIDPVLRLALGPDGTGNWSDVGRTGAGLPFVPSEVALDAVSLSGGRIELTQPEQPALVFENVEGEASAASLSGPYKLSVTYTFEGRPQELRLSTGASDADGLFRLKSALRDPDRGTTYLLDGDMTGLRETPSYAGAFVMRIAPSLPTDEQTAQQTAEQQPHEPLMPEDPLETDAAPIAGSQLSAFELKGELNATPGHAELPNFEIAIHTKGRSQMMKGKLALDFGAKSKAVAELAARWVDVDTLLVAGAPATGQVATSAVGVLNAMAERVLKQTTLVGEVALAVNLEQASIGGDLVGGVDLALTARDGAVTIDRFKAELPGENRIEASGRLMPTESGPVFAGPIKLEGSKLRTLVRWAAGDREMSGQAAVGAFALAANTTIGGGDLKLTQAKGELSGTKFSGGLRYRGGEQRLIDLVLDSDRLDLREVMGESAAWRSWVRPPSATKREAGEAPFDLLTSLRDGELHLSLRVGELLLPDVPAGRLNAKFSLASDTLEVERLDFDAQGALALNGNGRIERISGAPAGKVELRLRAATPEGLRVASELLGLSVGATKSKQFAGLVPLNLEIGLNAVRVGKATSASLEVQGKAGGADIALLANARGEPAKLAEAEIGLAGTIKGDRPHALLSLLAPSLAPERLAAVAGADQGTLTIEAHGVPKSGVSGRVELSTTSLAASFVGRGSVKPDGVALAGQASAKSGDASLALLLLGLEPAPSASGVPLDLRADIAKIGQTMDFTAISGQAAGEAVKGSAHFDFSGDKTRFTLKANVASVSLPSLLGSLVAWQRTPSTDEVLGAIARDTSEVWPPRGFALDPLVKVEGEIELEAKTLTLGAPFQIEQAVLLARIDEEGLSITDLQGELFGGSFAASGTLSPRGSGAELKAHAELATGKLDLLSRGLTGRVVAKGPLTMVLDISGEGLSPTGLVAGLSGGGTIFLDPGILVSLSPAPLKRVAIAAARTRKIKLDKDQIAAQTKALRGTLTRGTYPYAAVDLPFQIDNGTLKFEPAALANKSAETTINGYVELASLRVDSEWVMRLKGKRSADIPPVSIVFAGPLSDAGAITPAIDTAPIETYLTVRRMQEDVERLENLDVSGRNQPLPEAEPAGESGSEAEPTSDFGPSEEPSAEEQAAADKAATEKRSAEKLAIERRAAERAAAEKAAQAKRISEEKAAAAKAKAEKAAAAEAAAEKVAAERAAAAKAKAEKAAAAKAATEKAATEKVAAEKAAAAKAAAEKVAAERAAAAKAKAEKAAAKRATAAKAAAAKAAAAKAAAEKRAAQKAAAQKAAAEKAATAKAKTPPAATMSPAEPDPRAAVLEPDRGRPSPLPPTPEPAAEELPWAPNQPSAAQTPPLPVQDLSAPEPVTPAAAEDTTLAPPAAPRAPRASRPSRPAPAPDDWKKGISIFGGG